MNNEKELSRNSSLNHYFIAILSMLVLSLGFSKVQAGDLSQTPEQLVSELITAMGINDADRIRAVFADNASQEYERWWSRKKTGDDFRDWLKSDIIDVKGKVVKPVIKASGNQVVVTGTYENNDGYSSPADFLLVVENGKIISWTMRYD